MFEKMFDLQLSFFKSTKKAIYEAKQPKRHPVPVPGKKTLVPDSASSEGRAIRQVEILSNKLLTTAFEASLECVTVM